MRRILMPLAFVIAGMAAGAALLPSAAAQTSRSEAAGITVELVKIRIAIESGFGLQAETQALTALVSVHLQKVTAVRVRLDAVRRDLSTTAGEVANLNDQLAATQRMVASPPGPYLAPALQEQAARERRRIDTAERRQQELREAEAALNLELRNEEAALAPVMQRLDALRRR
jgi:chromosome segregation ATPase